MATKKPAPKSKAPMPPKPDGKKMPPLAMLGIAMPKGKAKGKKGC